MTEFGNYLIPCVIGLILVFGLVRRVPLFDTFLEGAKEGAKSTFGIIPALVGLITAVSMLKASGALDMFTAFIAPLAEKIGLPPQVVPLMLPGFRKRFSGPGRSDLFFFRGRQFCRQGGRGNDGLYRDYVLRDCCVFRLGQY